MRRARPAAFAALVTGALVVGACGHDPDAAPGPPMPDGGASAPDASLPSSLVDAALPPDDVVGDHVRVPYDGAPPPGPARVPVHAEVVSTRADVPALMFAAGEMQISGEPFAQGFAGRNLNDYDRTYLPTDQYILNAAGPDPRPVTDLFGFSTAVESYEYSKYHMNMVASEATAGVSLAAGPLIARRAEPTPIERLRARASELYVAASTDLAGYAVVPAPASNPLNAIGFQGLWPVLAPFRSFDPAMQPDHGIAQTCNVRGGYGGVPGSNGVPDYECSYNTLHLTNRDAQVDKTLVPAALGLATWKEALWSIDFCSRLHDSSNNPVSQIDPSEGPLVGIANNSILAGDSIDGIPGVYLGSSPLEGMWGLVMLEDMDNLAELLVASLTTADGATLGGFASKSAALAYDYTSPLRWFPAAVTVVEDAVTPMPGVASLTVADGASRSVDLAGLLLGEAMFFGMTDARNAGVGQRRGLALTFDGNPFAADDGLANGEETAHDRALSVLRVAFVDLDRMHTVAVTAPAAGSVTVDAVTFAKGDAGAGSGSAGPLVTTTSLAHVLVALRQTLLSLNGAITQYGAADPDPAADLKGILNAAPIHPTAPGAATTFSPRVRQVFLADAAFVRDVLTKPDGSVVNGASVVNGVATPSAEPATLESQTAAARALVEAFLVSGDEAYRDRARAVVRHLASAFYSSPARMYRGVEGGPDDVHMTPERFGWLQSALRETYKSLSASGDPVLDRAVLDDRIARVNKLFLNGWDDVDGNAHVDVPGECLAGRLQQGEQPLTGELGMDDFTVATSDRDKDCVLEIDDAQIGSVLAAEVHFHAP